jgi:hypothetical protein
VSRSEAELRADIADLERLLVDVPPHHGAGTRRSLEERLDDLRADLHRLQRLRHGRGGG